MCVGIYNVCWISENPNKVCHLVSIVPMLLGFDNCPVIM